MCIVLFIVQYPDFISFVVRQWCIFFISALFVMSPRATSGYTRGRTSRPVGLEPDRARPWRGGPAERPCTKTAGNVPGDRPGISGLRLYTLGNRLPCGVYMYGGGSCLEQ